jgi:hypothetical protein
MAKMEGTLKKQSKGALGTSKSVVYLVLNQRGGSLVLFFQALLAILEQILCISDFLFTRFFVKDFESFEFR